MLNICDLIHDARQTTQRQLQRSVHSLTIWSDYTISLKLQYNWLITNAKGHPAANRWNVLRCTATEKHESILFNFIDITHQ